MADRGPNDDLLKANQQEGKEREVFDISSFLPLTLQVRVRSAFRGYGFWQHRATNPAMSPPGKVVRWCNNIWLERLATERTSDISVPLTLSRLFITEAALLKNI